MRYGTYKCQIVEGKVSTILADEQRDYFSLESKNQMQVLHCDTKHKALEQNQDEWFSLR